ncbi:MAG: YggU family protein [Anaerolineales bacterium]|nr:YggU family protein [Anaerolineales bacterium]
MADRSFRLHDGKKGAALAVRVTPRASKNQIVGALSDGTIKIRITAAPNEGQANEELVKFLSDVLGVAKSRIEIVAGEAGRDKLISILDLDAETVHKKIVEHIE